MRHHNKNRKFGRVRKQRKALLRGLALALVERGKITTTEARAKELRPFVEKLVTRGKIDTVFSRRHIATKIGSIKGSKKIVDSISTEYKDRNGGYTRINKLSRRPGDASPMAVIEFV